jgi:hypothetical protein
MYVCKSCTLAEPRRCGRIRVKSIENARNTWRRFSGLHQPPAREKKPCGYFFYIERNGAALALSIEVKEPKPDDKHRTSVECTSFRPHYSIIYVSLYPCGRDL